MPCIRYSTSAAAVAGPASDTSTTRSPASRRTSCSTSGSTCTPSGISPIATDVVEQRPGRERRPAVVRRAHRVEEVRDHPRRRTLGRRLGVASECPSETTTPRASSARASSERAGQLGSERHEPHGRMLEVRGHAVGRHAEVLDPVRAGERRREERPFEMHGGRVARATAAAVASSVVITVASHDVTPGVEHRRVDPRDRLGPVRDRDAGRAVHLQVDEPRRDEHGAAAALLARDDDAVADLEPRGSERPVRPEERALDDLGRHRGRSCLRDLDAVLCSSAHRSAAAT